MAKGPAPRPPAWRTGSWTVFMRTTRKSLLAAAAWSPNGCGSGSTAGLYTPEQAASRELSTASSTARTSRRELRKKYGEDVSSTGSRQEARGECRSLVALWPVDSLGQVLEGGKKKAAGKNLIGIVYVDGPILNRQARVEPLRQATRSPKHAGSQGVGQVRRRQGREGRGVARRFPGRIGRGQRDHPQCHETRQSEEAAGCFHGPRCRQRRVLRRDGRTRSLPTPPRSPPRSAWLAGKWPRWTCGARSASLEQQPPRGQCRVAQLRCRVQPTEREKMQTWMNEVYGVFKGHVVAARGAKLKKPIDELAAGPRVHRPASPGPGPGGRDGRLEEAIQCQRPKRRGSRITRSAPIPSPRTSWNSCRRSSPTAIATRTTSRCPLVTGGLRRDFAPWLALPQLKGLDPQPAGSDRGGLAAARPARTGARRADDARNRRPRLNQST